MRADIRIQQKILRRAASFKLRVLQQQQAQPFTTLSPTDKVLRLKGVPSQNFGRNLLRRYDV